MRILFLLTLFLSNSFLGSFGQSNGDYQTKVATVTWTTASNWQKRIAGAWTASPDYPGQNVGAGIVWIQSGTTVNLNISPANSIAGITFKVGITSTLNISIFTLNVTGAVSYGVPADFNDEIITITSGTLNCGLVSMPVLTNSRTTQLNVTTGTVSVSGSIVTNTSGKNIIAFSGAGRLNITGNFTGAGTFTCNTSTVNYNRSTGSQIVDSYTYYNLNFTNSAYRILSGAVMVKNLLTLTNGSVDIGNFDLSIDTSASITGTFGSSSMVITSGTGSLKKLGNSTSDFVMTYPVGSGGYYTPMSITALAATVNSVASMYVHAIPIQRMPSTSALNKYWSVGTSNLSSISAEISFTYNVSEVEGAEANYVTRRFDGATFQVPEGADINTSTKILSAVGASVLAGDWTALDLDGETTVIDGPMDVFQGRKHVYTITPGNSDYNWVVSGGTIVSGQGTNSSVVTWDATTGAGNLSVSYTQNGFNVSIPALTITRSAFPLSCFQYYRQINIKGTMVSAGSLTNFPMMVNVTDASLKSIGNGGHIAHNAGYDIYFALDVAGTQPIEHQLEYYNSLTGQLVAWVKMSTLTTSNSSIYIFYGNHSITFDASTSDVWGSDYVGIYHLGQHLNDFGLGCNDGVNVGTSVITGKIGEGRLFNRSEKDFMQITNEPVFNFSNQMTVSFWMKLNSYPAVGNDWMDYIVKGDNKNWRFVGNRPNANIYYCFGNEYTDDLPSANNSIPLGNWIHIVGTFNGNNIPSPLKNLFVNGVKVTRTANHNSITGYLTDNSPVLVGINSQAQDTRAFDGIIDELRISNQFKPDEWIITEYRNQSDLTNVTLAGTEQSLPIGLSAVGGTASATPSSMFAREYSNLTLTGFTGTSIQWQSSSDDINFTDIAGKTGNPQQTDPLLSNTYFRAMVTNGGCPSASSSTLVSVTPPFITCSTGKRKKITIDDSKYVGSDDLVNFPFLLQINSDADLIQAPTGKVQSALGWDIRFTSSDGIALLPQQIESYNPVTGSILVWVQIPVIYAAKNTEIYMYYGDVAYSGSDPSISATFGSEYLGVYHMGTGTGKNLFELNDASERVNNAVNTGTTNLAAGKIGVASVFNGTSQYITLPDETLFDISNNGKLTLSGWVYINPYSISAYAKYFDKGTGSWTLRRDNGSNRIQMRQDYQSPEYLSAVNTSGITTGSGWHYIVSTFDHEVNNMVAYIDGSSAASSKNVPANQILQNNANQVRIGADAGGTLGNYFRGNMDEVRFQNVARTADWIKFEYDNMNVPVGFATISTEASCNLGAPTPGTASANKTTVCIDQSTTLTLTGYTGGIYWQKSTDNINWSFITGANNPTLNTGSIIRNTYYRASVSNCCEAFSNVILITFSATPPPTLSFAVSDVHCNGESNGAVDLTVTLGSGSYNYAWSNAEVTEDISLLSSAAYTVTVTDISTGCSLSDLATVNQPVVLSVSVSKTDETCPGSVNGSATATPSGGTLPYAYLWSNADTTSAITSLSNGLYSLTVTDNHSCTVTSFANIAATNVEPSIPSADDQDFCDSATIGDLVSIPGANGDLVNWYENSSGGTALTNGTSLIDGLTYYVETRNSTTGCVSQTRKDITVIVNPSPPTSLIYHD